MQFKFNRSPNSTTLHIDKEEQAWYLMRQLQSVVEHKAVEGTSIILHHPDKKIEGKQQFATVRVHAGTRRS